uniref:GTP binding protein 3, mitochondrial n=1 Tax=Sinocyclocheilus anshuiensis TaxID=1608454 RepID=A0A671MEJ4_9TELE
AGITFCCLRNIFYYQWSLPGLWPAEAGEFTRQANHDAFFLGLFDLFEIEVFCNKVKAFTVTFDQMNASLLTKSIHCLAHVEAFIDFMDAAVRQLQTDVENHLSAQRRGDRLRSGVQVGIAGSTNAGKSSLLNMLTQRPAAIVSPTAGTTRDVVEVPDTAGLRDTTDSVEQEGVRHARQRVEQADLPLVVVNLTQLPSEPQLVPVFLSGHLKSILEHSSHRRECILILNNSDHISAKHKRSIQAALEEAGYVPPACFLSCHTRDGLEDLLSIIQNRLKTLCGDPLISSPSLTQKGLRLGLTSLGRITGRTGAEKILDVIFKDFCIGK